jgi:hypothetical protein
VADGDGQAGAPSFLLSLDEQRDVFNGTCSLIYLFTTVFREAAEADGEDVLAEIVPRAGPYPRLHEGERGTCGDPHDGGLLAREDGVLRVWVRVPDVAQEVRA